MSSVAAQLETKIKNLGNKVITSKKETPIFEQVDNLYKIENQNKVAKPFEIENPALKCIAYIRHCNDISVVIHKKINSIMIEHCKNVKFTVENVISSIEIIHSVGVKLQIKGRASSLVVDNSSECDIYTNRENLDLSITSSQIAAVNLLVPRKDDPEDYEEHPIPAQFVHTLDQKTGKLNSKVSDIYY